MDPFFGDVAPDLDASKLGNVDSHQLVEVSGRGEWAGRVGRVRG